MKKKIFYTLFIVLFFICIFSTYSHALGDPKIVSKINSAFQSIESWILKISTPAAAVAVGTGLFMKKFSFGDEEKIKTGKKYQTVDRERCQKYGTKAENMSNPAEETTQTV